MSTSAVLQKSQNNAISTSTNSPSNDKERIASEREDDNVINNTVHTTKMSKSTTATTQNAIQQGKDKHGETEICFSNRLEITLSITHVKGSFS